MPLKATKRPAKRVDYEYERNGQHFYVRRTAVGLSSGDRARRTKIDWAIAVAHLLDTRYAGCEHLTLVCDNLNTHTKGAFYTAFPPEPARAYVQRIQFCHTPKHGC